MSGDGGGKIKAYTRKEEGKTRKKEKRKEERE